MSPKLSAFHTLFHTELSDNSPQPSGTIMVLKSVEIDPADPGMNYFSFSSPFLHSRGEEGGRCFPSVVTRMDTPKSGIRSETGTE